MESVKQKVKKRRVKRINPAMMPVAEWLPLQDTLSYLRVSINKFNEVASIAGFKASALPGKSDKTKILHFNIPHIKKVFEELSFEYRGPTKKDNKNEENISIK